MSPEDMNELDQFVKDNTLERFGPVRMVRPALVFELSLKRSLNQPGIKAVLWPWHQR